MYMHNIPVHYHIYSVPDGLSVLLVVTSAMIVMLKHHYELEVLKLV